MQEIWVKADSLPSQFRGYPNMAKIEYRPYTYGEIKALSDPALSDDEKEKILLAGIRSSFPKTDIYYDDYKMLLVMRVLSTMKTQRFEVAYYDSDVDADGNPLVLKAKKNLMDIEFQDLAVASLPLKVRISDEQVLDLNLPTIGRFNDFLHLDSDDDIYLFVGPGPMPVVQKLVDQLDPEVVGELKKIIDQYLRLKCAVTCQKTNGEDVTVPVAVNTVTPFRDEERPQTVRIESGLD